MITVSTSEYCSEDQMQYWMYSPEHKCESQSETAVTYPLKGVQLTNVQSVLAENLDSSKISWSIHYKTQEPTILYFSLFERIQSQRKFMRLLSELKKATAFGSNFSNLPLKCWFCFNSGNSLCIPQNWPETLPPPESLPIRPGYVLPWYVPESLCAYC